MKCPHPPLILLQLLALIALTLTGCDATGGTLLTASGGTLRGDALGGIAIGGKTAIRITLDEPQSLDLRVRFAEAPFSGTRLDVAVNGTQLAPYFAFGGDTRYGHVRGVDGMRPPIATIEGRWLIPTHLLEHGENHVTLQTTGILPSEILNEVGPAPRLVIDQVTLRPADGGDLPEYANSIYYDFAVWNQGYAWGRGGMRRFNHDNALLGIINGKGMPNLTPALASETGAWDAKRGAERLWLDWGFREFEFYTIWSFCGEPDKWANFIDVDDDPETQSHFHDQTIFKHLIGGYEPAHGADVLLYDIDKWRAALEPGIRAMAPYATYYNLKCEQHGPWGQGFGDDGQAFADLGYDGDVWASNYYQAMKAARDLVQQYDPEDGRVEEQNHWLPSIRAVLFDTAERRGQPMGDMIDILTTHFGSLAEYDLDENSRAIPGKTLHLQYPAATEFESGLRARWMRHVTENGINWVKDSTYPEVAIDFNRYRLGRTEDDMTLADPATHRWGNGQPFDYRAGFRGDELMYNSEHGIWQGYAAPSPYQFLHGMFAYSLLPTGTSEPRDLSITTRQSVTETEEMNVNLYGQWIEGAGHTKRLRTIDPLYGDMFGWTGNEHCNFGDYISMVGIKDHHHRLEPHNAFNLVRRLSYAFITAGTLFPAWLEPEHSDDLFVKALVQRIEGRNYVCIYAANFSNDAQTLDMTVPFALPNGGTALVFDEKTWDWAAHERRALARGSQQRVTHRVAPLGAWMMAIPIPDDALATALDLPAAPRPVAPAIDAHIASGLPEFRFDAASADGEFHQIELAREARFRDQDRILLSEPAAMAGRFIPQQALEPGQRLWWRVRTVDADGRAGPWSHPRSIISAWPEYAARFAPQPDTDPDAWAALPTWDWLDHAHEVEAPNLAWLGEIYASGGHMNAGSRAADGQISSQWSNENNSNVTEFMLPAEWAVLWSRPQTISVIKILWPEDLKPAGFTVQISDDAQQWTDLANSDQVPDELTEIDLDQPVSARYLRIALPEAANGKDHVGIREVFIK